MDPNTQFVEKEIAQFLIQVNLVYEPNSLNLAGHIHVFKKNGYFGNGDELMRFCPAQGCMGLIDLNFFLTEEEENRLNGEAVVSKWPADIRARHDNWFEVPTACPTCHLVSPKQLYSDSWGFKLPLEKVASRLAKLWESLDGDADVYMVKTRSGQYMRDAKAELQSLKPDLERYKMLLELARKKEMVFYSMANINADTESASLEGRFIALLRA